MDLDTRGGEEREREGIEKWRRQSAKKGEEGRVGGTEGGTWANGKGDSGQGKTQRQGTRKGGSREGGRDVIGQGVDQSNPD